MHVGGPKLRRLLQGSVDRQISLKGTQVGSASRQGAATLAGPTSKPPMGPNPSSRVMRNSSSLRKGSDASYPGLADLAGNVECAPEEFAGVGP